MSKKHKTNTPAQVMTLRVEGSVPVARLQELLRMEPMLKLRIAAPSVGSPLPRSEKVR